MNIVGFGDSFILGLALDEEVLNSHLRWPYLSQHNAWNASYQGMIGNHFKCVPEFRGVSGTGPWNMFFDFLNYERKDEIDVAIIAWSEIYRLYHNKFKPINVHKAFDKDYMESASDHEKDVIQAAQGYYKCLTDQLKLDYELSALMMMFDRMTTQYPHINFIHLPCFTLLEPGEWWGRSYFTKKPSELKYYHDFKHGMEIRPALMYLSVLDEWPDDLKNDKRECHMTARANRLLADSIIYCIENFQPGKLIEMDVSVIK